MLGRLRSDRWRKVGFRFRAIGALLLMTATFLPFGWMVLMALIAAGLLLFSFGCLVWLARDPDSWRR